MGFFLFLNLLPPVVRIGKISSNVSLFGLSPKLVTMHTCSFVYLFLYSQGIRCQWSM